MEEWLLEKIMTMLNYPELLSESEFLRVRRVQQKMKIHSSREWLKAESEVIGALWESFTLRNPHIEDDLIQQEDDASDAELRAQLKEIDEDDFEALEDEATVQRILNIRDKGQLDQNHIKELTNYDAQTYAVSEIVHRDPYIRELSMALWSQFFRKYDFLPGTNEIMIDIITQAFIEEAADFMLASLPEIHSKKEPLFADGMRTPLDDITKEHLFKYSRDASATLDICMSFPDIIQERIGEFIEFLHVMVIQNALNQSTAPLTEKGFAMTCILPNSLVAGAN